MIPCTKECDFNDVCPELGHVWEMWYFSKNFIPFLLLKKVSNRYMNGFLALNLLNGETEILDIGNWKLYNKTLVGERLL